MNIPGHIFFALLAITFVWCVYLLVVFSKKQSSQPTGIIAEYKDLYDRITHCSHKVELAFLEEEVYQFDTAHKGERFCGEYFSELMVEIRRRETWLILYAAGVKID